MVTALEQVKFNGKTYFVDNRLNELRNVNDVNEIIKFKEVIDLFESLDLKEYY